MVLLPFIPYPVAKTFLYEVETFVETVADFCTAAECPVMNAGDRYEYHWCDGSQYTKPTRVAAMQYMQLLIRWSHGLVDSDSSENIVPDRVKLRSVFKRLFRVYAHIYYSHFDTVVELELVAHFNTSFQHFMYFVKEFSLIEAVELAPLSQLINQLCPDVC